MSVVTGIRAAVAAGDRELLRDVVATTTPERQLVAIAEAFLGGDRDRAEALARDHLADRPDSPLAEWLGTLTQEPS